MIPPAFTSSICHCVWMDMKPAWAPNIQNRQYNPFQWISDHAKILQQESPNVQEGSYNFFFLFNHLKTSTWWKYLDNRDFSNFLFGQTNHPLVNNGSSDIYPLIFPALLSPSNNSNWRTTFPFPEFKYPKSLLERNPIIGQIPEWFYPGKHKTPLIHNRYNSRSFISCFKKKFLIYLILVSITIPEGLAKFSSANA